MENKKIPVLFACCIPTMGTSRGLICDVQRKAYQFIPDSLYEILTKHKGKTVTDIKKEYENKFDEVIQEYFDFLVENEFVFYTEIPEAFPELDLTWKEPVQVTNTIIDLKEKDDLIDFESLFEQLDRLGCEHVQLRIFDDTPIVFIEKIFEKIGDKRITSVEIILKYFPDLQIEKLQTLCVHFPRIISVIIHSTTSEIENSAGKEKILFTNQKITSEIHCGIIDQLSFNSNIKSFTESQHHNSCLNRKISIDTEGNIKNCPSMSQSFGNIKDTTLQAALDHPDFKKYWNITKDKIHVCKDCEFRYICTDCRAYVEDPEDLHSKPLKCGYNPYTGEWSEWSTNPLKQKAIAYYGMEELVKKEE